MTAPLRVPAAPATPYVAYDVRRLSYASTFPDPWKARTIRALEWMTGKVRLRQSLRIVCISVATPVTSDRGTACCRRQNGRTVKCWSVNESCGNRK